MGRNEAVKRERYRLIDSLRGFALLNMVAFHLCYDIFMIYGVDDNWALRPESVAWERFICVSFILISLPEIVACILKLLAAQLNVAFTWLSDKNPSSRHLYSIYSNQSISTSPSPLALV